VALIDTHRLRIAAAPFGIAKIDAHAESVTFHFLPKPPIDPMRVIALVQKNRKYTLSGQDRLRMKVDAPEVSARIGAIRATLHALSS
jgi:transcription-repair coupling factor (superfamily II helicase)